MCVSVSGLWKGSERAEERQGRDGEHGQKHMMERICEDARYARVLYVWQPGGWGRGAQLGLNAILGFRKVVGCVVSVIDSGIVNLILI